MLLCVIARLLLQAENYIYVWQTFLSKANIFIYFISMCHIRAFRGNLTCHLCAVNALLNV